MERRVKAENQQSPARAGILTGFSSDPSHFSGTASLRRVSAEKVKKGQQTKYCKIVTQTQNGKPNAMVGACLLLPATPAEAK